MSDDFFGRLELELRGAAGRKPRRFQPRAMAASGLVTAMVAAGLLAAVLVPAAFLVGGGEEREAPKRAEGRQPPVGTVIPKGTGHRESDSTVVAPGRSRLAGPWQLEVSRGPGVKDPKTGEVYEKAGLRCLWLVFTDPPKDTVVLTGGYCGIGRGFRKTPGFSRAQANVPAQGRREVKEVVVFGRAPERTSKVVLTGRGGRVAVVPQEGPRRIHGDFYAFSVKPTLRRARINWLDRDGRPGGRGISMLPPLDD
jgi:hypothetical protein